MNLVFKIPDNTADLVPHSGIQDAGLALSRIDVSALDAGSMRICGIDVALAAVSS